MEKRELNHHFSSVEESFQYLGSHIFLVLFFLVCSSSLSPTPFFLTKRFEKEKKKKRKSRYKKKKENEEEEEEEERL